MPKPSRYMIPYQCTRTGPSPIAIGSMSWRWIMRSQEVGAVGQLVLVVLAFAPGEVALHVRGDHLHRAQHAGLGLVLAQPRRNGVTRLAPLGIGYPATVAAVGDDLDMVVRQQQVHQHAAVVFG